VSRQIDLSKPLSDEDRAYLLARGREQLVAKLDAQNGDEEAARLANYVPGSAVDQPEGVPDTPGLGAPNAEAARTAAAVEDDDEVEAGTEDNYETWTNEQLREELDSRDLQTSGKKKELVARLRADDADTGDEGDE
jgi:hypothetical protein